MDVQAKLDRAFHPTVGAAVGAKSDNDYMWLRSHEPFVAFGNVYHVNIDRRAAAARKPALVWKVGSTTESARAGVAHTAGEPVPAELWDATLTVCGAIKVTSMAR